MSRQLHCSNNNLNEQNLDGGYRVVVRYVERKRATVILKDTFALVGEPGWRVPEDRASTQSLNSEAVLLKNQSEDEEEECDGVVQQPPRWR